MASSSFSRELSRSFVAWLHSASGHRLLAAFKEQNLDLRLRDDYLNAYAAECSLARVAWHARQGRARLSISRAYLSVSDLPPASSAMEGRANVEFELTPEAIEFYVRALPGIQEVARSRYSGLEGEWEERCIRANRIGTPLLVLDRQIAISGSGRRLDMLAISAHPEKPLLIAVELKAGLDNRIQNVSEQCLAYVTMLSNKEGKAREDVLGSYARACAQLRELGFEAPDPGLLRPGTEVVGLVALAGYNAESELLARAMMKARELPGPLFFCHMDDSAVLPPREGWLRAS